MGKEFTDAINKLSELLSTNIPTINEKMALDAAALVKDRVINTGKNAKGSSLGEYSDNELPLFFFKGKSNNKTTRFI